MASNLPFDEQNVENEVEQMGLAPLSREPSQQPVIEFPIVEDSDEDHDDDEDEDGNGEHGFFSGVVSSNPENGDDWDSDGTWSDASSGDSAEDYYYWLQNYGGLFLNPSSGRIEPVYRCVLPNPHTSSNVAAAALKEPISLLTKYRYQRLRHESKYFHASIPSPSKALCRARQVSRGSLLKKVQNVDDQTVRWA